MCKGTGVICGSAGCLAGGTAKEFLAIQSLRLVGREKLSWFAMQANLVDCLLMFFFASGGRESHRSQGEQKKKKPWP
jgi:hypothetical protein